MAFAYSIHNQGGVYFITCTVNQWVDIFTRKEYSDIIIESLKFCQKEKGLEIFAYVIMTVQTKMNQYKNHILSTIIVIKITLLALKL